MKPASDQPNPPFLQFFWVMLIKPLFPHFSATIWAKEKAKRSKTFSIVFLIYFYTRLLEKGEYKTHFLKRFFFFTQHKKHTHTLTHPDQNQSQRKKKKFCLIINLNEKKDQRKKQQQAFCISRVCYILFIIIFRCFCFLFILAMAWPFFYILTLAF